MSGHTQQKSFGNKTGQRPNKKPTRSQRLNQMARKREERAVKAAHKKQRQAKSYFADDESYANFMGQLAKMGLELRDITGDGNCLFRALGDQLEGNGNNHLKHRRDVVDFMLDHREDFEPFVEDDVPFEKHVKNLSEIGTYAGNDAIVAFARMHTLHVVIHQVNTPCWQIHGTEDPAAKELHISYHNGDHYSSIRKIGDMSHLPANIKLDTTLNLNPVKKDNVKQTDNYVQNSWDNGSSYLCEEENYNEYGDILPEEDSAQNNNVLESIKRLTGCEDESLILQTLENVGYAEEVATDLILEVMQTSISEPSESASADSGLWSEEGTGSRLFGGVVNGASQSQASSQDQSHSGAKPKQQCARQTKQTKKFEKKLRAQQRRRQERLGTGAPTSGGGLSSDEDVTTVAHVMGTLKI